MNGKETCNALKQLRKDIAAANDIEWHESECHHEGNCLGTCPKCESELRRLEQEINIKKQLGKVIKVAGLGLVLATSAVGCQKQEIEQIDGDIEIEQLAGDVPDTTPCKDDDPEFELAGDVEMDE